MYYIKFIHSNPMVTCNKRRRNIDSNIHYSFVYPIMSYMNITGERRMYYICRGYRLKVK